MPNVYIAASVGNKLNIDNKMVYNVRQSNIWIFIPLAVILSLSVTFSIAFIFQEKADRFITGLIILPFFGLSFIVSAILSSRLRKIVLENGFLILDNSRKIEIQNIDYYYENSNFLFDGLMMKTKEGKKFYLTSLAIFNESNEFKILKNNILKHDTNDAQQNAIIGKEKNNYKILNVLGWIKIIIILIANIFWIIETNNIFSKIIVVFLSLIIIGMIITRRR